MNESIFRPIKNLKKKTKKIINTPTPTIDSLIVTPLKPPSLSFLNYDKMILTDQIMLREAQDLLEKKKKLKLEISCLRYEINKHYLPEIKKIKLEKKKLESEIELLEKDLQLISFQKLRAQEFLKSLEYYDFERYDLRKISENKILQAEGIYDFNEKKLKNKEKEEKIKIQKKKKEIKNKKNQKKKLPHHLLERQIQTLNGQYHADAYINIKGQHFSEKKKKTLFNTPPEYITKLYNLLELADRRRKLPVPQLIRHNIPLTPYKLYPEEIQKLLLTYNFIYNFYWTLRSYNIFKSKTWVSFIKAYFSIKKNFNIKKAMCDPFEDFLNSSGEDWPKNSKKNKKKKYEILEPFFSDIGISRGELTNLKTEARVSLLFSLYMGKKNVKCGPSDVARSIETHKALMTRVPEVDQNFKTFVQEQTAQLFNGFKMRKNPNHVLPATSYCIANEDVCLHNFAIQEGANRQDYNAFIDNDELEGKWSELYENFLSYPVTHKVKVINDSSKVRVITTNHPATFLMKDFQHSVHTHLKNHPNFQFIGKEVGDSIECDHDGWVLSGDYTNSTDFIPCEMTGHIYDVILGKVQGRPHLKKLVRHHTREILEYPDGEMVEMKSGQLMGGLLSFPALCILNYCISKYVGINGKKQINGDDLLAICDKGDKEIWCNESPRLGMTPNHSKSHIHPEFGTFNSQLLRKVGGRLYHIHHFNISKLSKASLKDLLNLNVRKHNPFTDSFMRTFFEFRSRMALYTGDVYSKYISKKIYNYAPFFALYHTYLKELGILFLGSIGIGSNIYEKGEMTPEKLDKMISERWLMWDTDEMINISNGVIWYMDEVFHEDGELDDMSRKYLGVLVRKLP